MVSNKIIESTCKNQFCMWTLSFNFVIWKTVFFQLTDLLNLVWA